MSTLHETPNLHESVTVSSDFHLASVSTAVTANTPAIFDVPECIEDAEIPKLEHIPEPLLWRVVVKQIGIKRKVGSFYLPDQTVADQEWTHGMCMVVKVGPAVYRGKKFEDLGLTPGDGPQPGDVYSFEARQPKRFRVDGVQLIEVADDALTMKFNKDHLDKISFRI